MKIAKESWVIAAIGLIDLILTILFIKLHGAQEANPLFRHLWAIGPITFVTVKILFLAGPITVLEWARRSNPRFVARASRGVIAAYVVCYGLGVARLNHHSANAQSVIQASDQADAHIEAMLARMVKERGSAHVKAFRHTAGRRLTTLRPSPARVSQEL